jgi:hypothetical protein
MEWKTPICIRQGANNCQSRMLIKEIIADNQCRPSTLWFVASLWIKRE